MDIKEENIQRVDNKPASIYSIFVFAIVFFVCYMFYPQISMLVPFLGENVTVKTSYSKLQPADMKNAAYVVVGVAGERSDTVATVEAGEPDVYCLVDFECVDVLKGNIAKGESLRIAELGGSALIRNPKTDRQEKYNVSYENAAKLGKETYLLFVDSGMNIMGGKFGIYTQQANGTFKDIDGYIYSKEDILGLIAEAQ